LSREGEEMAPDYIQYDMNTLISSRMEVLTDEEKRVVNTALTGNESEEVH
jgi:hypothetical protein